jgi:hypothetical protein
MVDTGEGLLSELPASNLNVGMAVKSVSPSSEKSFYC